MADGAVNDVIGVYRRQGANWAALRGDRPTEGAWLDRFCALVEDGGEVIDIGCGTGLPMARDLGRRGFGVTGLDGAPQMLALFRRNLPDGPAILADMRQLSLGRRFAGLLAWDSFFHLSSDDQRAMFPRFQAHAASRAALMFTSGPGAVTAIGDLAGEPLCHASLDPAGYRALLDTHGFTEVDRVAEDPACGHRTAWLAQQAGLTATTIPA